MRLTPAIYVALSLATCPLFADGSARRLVVFLVDGDGQARIADALTCPIEVRVNRHTGTPETLDFLRYSFTPHHADLPQHWTVSF